MSYLQRSVFIGIFSKISAYGKDLVIVDSTSFRRKALPGKRPEKGLLQVDIKFRHHFWISAQDFCGNNDCGWLEGRIAQNFHLLEKWKSENSTRVENFGVLKIGGRMTSKNADGWNLHAASTEIPGYLAMKSFVETICEDFPRGEKI